MSHRPSLSLSTMTRRDATRRRDSEVRRSHRLFAVPMSVSVSADVLMLLLLMMRAGVGVDRAVVSARLRATTHLVLLRNHAQHVRLSRVERLDSSLTVTGYPARKFRHAQNSPFPHRKSFPPQSAGTRRTASSDSIY